MVYQPEFLLLTAGLCVAGVHRQVTETHATDENSRHLLGVEQCLICGHIEMQMGLMDTAELPQIRT